MQLDESELVERSKAGELEAFNEIVERYRSLVFNTAARILGSRSAADDAAQKRSYPHTAPSAASGVVRCGLGCSA